MSPKRQTINRPVTDFRKTLTMPPARQADLVAACELPDTQRSPESLTLDVTWEDIEDGNATE